MEFPLQRCCGVDVHKDQITVCLRVHLPGEAVRQHLREYATDTASLESFCAWLKSQDCSEVAMESTGVYWIPVFNVLEEEGLNVCLVNARHMKNVPGRKTDQKDAQWIAQLFMQGLLRPSLIPDASIRAARELIRRRKKLIEQRASETNRLGKTLESANIKLGSVVSDLQGVSAQRMLRALVNGERDVVVLANFALGTMKKKKEELKTALKGRIQEHHVMILKQILQHMGFLDQQIEELTDDLDRRLKGFEEDVELLRTIPGVEKKMAQTILVEIGGSIDRFPSVEHLASWAGMCPGNRQSGGKVLSGRARHGNRWLRAALMEAAWAASHTKQTYINAFYHRVTSRRGKKRAAFAVAHKVLRIAYQALKTRRKYAELGEDYYLRLDEGRRRRHCVLQLNRMGYEVELKPMKAAQPTA